jgi:hypothetical protein
LSREELESFVVGTATEDDTARVRQHVAACRQCALLLGREARLEVALLEALHDAAEPAPKPAAHSARAREPWTSWLPEGLGFAALLLLCLAAAWTQWRDRSGEWARHRIRYASATPAIPSPVDSWRDAPGFLVESPAEVGLAVAVPQAHPSTFEVGAVESL